MPLSPDLHPNELGVLEPTNDSDIHGVYKEVKSLNRSISLASAAGERHYMGAPLSLIGNRPRLEINVGNPDIQTDLTWDDSEILLQVEEHTVQQIGGIALIGHTKYIFDHERLVATRATESVFPGEDSEQLREDLSSILSLKERPISKLDLIHLHSLINPFVLKSTPETRKSWFGLIPHPRRSKQ